MGGFSLEVLLNYRKNKEERLAKELAEIKNQINQKKAKIDILEEEKKDILHILRKNQRESKVIWDIVSLFHYMTILERRVKSAKEDLDAINIQYQIKHKQLIEAAKERKILEKLKERWQQLKQRSLFRKEQYFLDEVAINGFFRHQA